MSSDAILFFQQVPKMIWDLMNSFDIPGLGFTPGSLIMGILSIRILIWAIGNVFSLGQNAVSDINPGYADEAARQRELVKKRWGL